VSKYLKIFCREAGEHLASLQSGLLVLEKQPGSAGLLHELLRNAHTLKGSARMVGLSDISAITHLMEERLKGMDQGSSPVDARGIDLLLKGADAVALLTDALSRGEAPGFDIERFVEALERGDLERATLEGAAARAGREASAPQAPGAPDDTVRASVKTLDSLVNLAGEMIISRRRLEARLPRLREIAGALDPAQAAPLMEFQRELEEDVLHQDRLIAELHEKAMGLRMLPLRSISDGFQRLVRDLSHKLGKEVRLELVGGSIEMDRVLLEGLKPMLLHLLTNAVCHGIESPEERGAAGKDPEGVLSIAASHQGESVRIAIRDDGRGMDPARIKAKALARGVIDEREAQGLKDEDALYLTLRPGFSTSDIVTEISGRGFGMDVVQRNLERVKGNLTLKSELGRFSEIVLQLPLTLSVLGALVLQSGGETFAVPLDYVQEIFKLREEEITRTGAGEEVTLRGQATALFSLAALLGLPERTAPGGAAAGSALVLKLCDQRIACRVDALFGSSELVVKGLGRQFRNVRFLLGATILEDGYPALILNVPDLFAACDAPAPPLPRRNPAAPPPAPRPRRVLVVDDSITTRTMEQSILATRGYQVQVAVCGEDALERALAGRFDLVISDLEMPGIDGFQLTRALRALDAYRDTPIIIVSSLSRDEEKRRALEAGAQAYIVKGSFDQEELLETVQLLIGGAAPGRA